MLRVVFRASAGAQVVDAQAWYDNQRQGLGAEFARSLESAINRVVRNPLAAPVVHQDVRRVLLKRFPYSVFYMVEGDALLVLSCMHTRRAPLNWGKEKT
jgi:plasmid stabilization system protein ParE